ncbi:MAG: alpha/beta fold hydrolase [Oceanidesulfovibrio sp.]
MTQMRFPIATRQLDRAQAGQGGASMDSITVDGETIAYQEVGEGPAMVFISGLGGVAQEWLPDMRHFGASMRCITLDHPGVNGTPLPQGFCGAPQMADRIAAGLAALGVESAVVMGMSMGGAVAQELALRHPQLVKRLVLTGAFARLDTRARRAVTTLVELLGCCDLKTAARMFYWVAFNPEFFVQNLPALDDMVDQYVADPLDHAVFEYQLQACLEHDTRDRLAGIGCPALVVHGTTDILVRPYLAEELAVGMPAAQLLLLDNGGHSCNWEQPESFRRKVAAFIAGGG